MDIVQNDQSQGSAGADGVAYLGGDRRNQGQAPIAATTTTAATQPSYDSQWAKAPPGFSCACHVQGPGIARVTACGELDLASAPQLDGALSKAARGSMAVIIDRSELTFMDSSGLHAILTARGRLAAADCRLVLIQGCRQVQPIFELTGVDSVLEFVSAPDAHGLAAVQSS